MGNTHQHHPGQPPRRAQLVIPSPEHYSASDPGRGRYFLSFIADWEASAPPVVLFTTTSMLPISRSTGFSYALAVIASSRFDPIVVGGRYKRRLHLSQDPFGLILYLFSSPSSHAMRAQALNSASPCSRVRSPRSKCAIAEL